MWIAHEAGTVIAMTQAAFWPVIQIATALDIQSVTSVKWIRLKRVAARLSPRKLA